MQDADDNDIIFAVQIENAIVLADQITVLRMNGDQRVQRASSSGEAFERESTLFFNSVMIL